MIPENFRKWACSLSGCDGGNEDADFWLCGIEWGHRGSEDGSYYRNELPKEIAAGTYSYDTERYNWRKTLKTPFGRNVAKLYAAYSGYDVENYKDLSKAYNGTELFKLNLYPIAFHSTDPKLWKIWGLQDITGMPEKHLFQTWCFLNRFPAISKLVNEKRPRVIVGTGLGYLRDFFMCFGGSGKTADQINVGEIEPQQNSNNRGNRKYYWAKVTPNTTLVVLPFFSGSNGLNSNYLIQKAGDRIRELCI